MKICKLFFYIITAALTAAAVFCLFAALSSDKSESGAEAVPAAARPQELSPAEENLLLRFICAESEPETPLVCKISVAAVVLNRIGSSGYPDNAVNVIFAAGAFSSVTDGTINREMSEKELSEAQDALQLALRGADPTGGALCFAREDGAESLTITLRAGGMVFGFDGGYTPE